MVGNFAFEFGEEIIEIEVEIEGSPRRPDDESSGWKLEFLLELKSLGPVRVSLEMRNGRLGIDFSVTASINERLDGALPVLRDRLLASGLQLDHVSKISVQSTSQRGKSALRKLGSIYLYDSEKDTKKPPLR